MKPCVASVLVSCSVYRLTLYKGDVSGREVEFAGCDLYHLCTFGGVRAGRWRVRGQSRDQS
jgi:hypothetical protein